MGKENDMRWAPMVLGNVVPSSWCPPKLNENWVSEPPTQLVKNAMAGLTLKDLNIHRNLSLGISTLPKHPCKIQRQNTDQVQATLLCVLF